MTVATATKQLLGPVAKTPEFGLHTGRKPFILPRDFFDVLFSYRSLWLEGRTGKGKTALSFAIADEMIRRRKSLYCVSNVLLTRQIWPYSFFDSVEFSELNITRETIFKSEFWHDNFQERWGFRASYNFDDDPEARIFDSTVIFDEAASHVGRTGADKRSMDALRRFLRKRNLIILLPSVEPVHRDLCKMRVERVFNLFVLGIPYWIFHWSVYRNRTLRGYFAFCPLGYFGLYDTFFEPAGFTDMLVDLLLAGIDEGPRNAR